MDLLASFQQHWQQGSFASPGQPILLAVSGGRDSMVLANLFLSAKIEFGIAHCNFSLRGLESDGDEASVKDWAETNNIRFYTTRFDTAIVATEWKKGIQETARELRYQWLEQIRQQHSYYFVATAHHANDNAETLLINLFKGTGIAGLHGIRAKHSKLIRPLLFATREQILLYAADNEVAFREDSSNASDKYLRNGLRLNILPVIEQYFPNVTERLNESITRFAQAELLYNKEIARQIKKLKELRGKDIYVPVLKLLKMDALETICYELFKSYGFSPVQVPHIIDLANAPSGKFMESDHFKIIKDRDFLIVTEKQVSSTEFIQIQTVPCKVEAEGRVLDFSYVHAGAPLPADNSVATLNADALQFPLVLRKWKTGDYFYPFGMGMKKKKLSRFFIDQKIPVHEKERIWVLESDKKIVWVVGLRIDERFKVKPGASSLLRITLKSKNEGGASAG